MDPHLVQPLIHSLLNRGFEFGRGDCAAASTFTFTENNLSEALWLLYRGAAGDLEKADRCLDDVLRRVGDSGRAGIIYWNGGKRNVISFTEQLDERLKHRTDSYIMLKRYGPEKVRSLAGLYTELYYEAKRDRGFPLTEIAARTVNFLLSRRTGENLAYEYGPKQVRLHRSISRKVADDALVLAEYIGRRAERAIPFPYEARFIESAIAIRPFLPPGAQRELDYSAAHDARLLAKQLAADRQVPHLDPKSPNVVVEDHRPRFIDLESALEYRISIGDLLAHIWLDPTYDLPFELRSREMRNMVPGAFYYPVRRVGHALLGTLRAPLPRWAGVVHRRFSGYLDMMAGCSALAADEYRSARLFAQIDRRAAEERFLVLSGAKTALRGEVSSSRP